jgi:hypothetical protein
MQLGVSYGLKITTETKISGPWPVNRLTFGAVSLACLVCCQVGLRALSQGHEDHWISPASSLL